MTTTAIPMRRSALLRFAMVGVFLSTANLELPARAQDGEPPKGEIDYGYWGNALRAETTEAVSRGFEREFPGTRVQSAVAEYFAYLERLTVQAAAKDLPCVTQMQTTFLSTYTARNVLRPLDDLVQKGVIDVKGIDPAVLGTGRIDGKLYMIPTGSFVRLVAVNVAMARQRGIDLPPMRPSFNEMKSWAIAAQKKLPSGVFAIENDGALLFTLYSWVAGHGQSFFKDNAIGFPPSVLAAYFDYWEDLRRAGVAFPADRLDEQTGPIEMAPMAKGLALSGTRDIPHIAQVMQTLASAGLPAEVRLFSNPVETGIKSGNVPGANGLSISANCKNVPTAAAYINYFANAPRAAIAFRSSNGVVVSKSGREALLADAKTPAAVRASLQTLAALAQEGDIAPATYPPGYQALQGILRRSYESVALRGQKSTDAAAQFIAEANRTLRSARAR